MDSRFGGPELKKAYTDAPFRLIEGENSICISIKKSGDCRPTKHIRLCYTR